MVNKESFSAEYNAYRGII